MSEHLERSKLLAANGKYRAAVDSLYYVYDEEGALYGGVYRSPATSTSPTYFTAVTNDHGDVLELCDADGNAFAAYRYDAWGLPQGAGTLGTGIWKRTTDTALVTSTLAGQIASRQVLRYASYAYDAESGLYYCSARYYDPATRQWTTGDPAKADGEESAYQYCEGNPISGIDPTGLHVAKTSKWQSESDGRARVAFLAEWNQATISLQYTGVQFTRVRVRATLLNRSYRLAKVGLRFYMQAHGHSNHDGGDFVGSSHLHQKVSPPWLIPASGQPKSGKVYYQDPTASVTHLPSYPRPKVYNALNRLSELTNDCFLVKARLRYFNIYTGAEKHLESVWVWSHYPSAAN